MAIPIRDAREEDLLAVLEIYNDVMATSTAIYSEQPSTLEDRIAWWQGRVGAGYPVLVAEDASGVTGFASFGDFRPRPGYRFTVERLVSDIGHLYEDLIRETRAMVDRTGGPARVQRQAPDV